MATFLALFVRRTLEAYSATRYLISLAAIGLMLLYAGLTVADVVPFYIALADSLNVSSSFLFGCAYLISCILVIAAWHATIQRSPTPDMEWMLRWRPIYRQTDRGGLLLFDGLLLVVLALIAAILHRFVSERFIREPAFFWIALSGLPIVIGMLMAPFQRPRRYVVPGSSAGSQWQPLSAIAIQFAGQSGSPSEVGRYLSEYNNLAAVAPLLDQLRQRSQPFDPADPALPDGFALEIPPRLR
ncbi:MAG TPA: hypothetical protein VD886_23295 [Herpetosiphonaceae bacterium]|nr:hypothetical protein [Herpetosiphonaceae bacterium]